jgi:hypothetical protein
MQAQDLDLINRPEPKYIQPHTLATCKARVVELGFTVDEASSWENDRWIYAFSVECYPGSYGEPKVTVGFSKETGYLQVFHP